MKLLYEYYDYKDKKIEINEKVNRYKSVNFEYLQNLNNNFIPREYQNICFARLEDKFCRWNKQKPLHLFFNLATGSGKTLVMAENILYLYEQGYRNFIFLVHEVAILDKTRDNFLNKKSKKYLFSQEIIFNSKKIRINETESFSNTNNDNINIIFTTCAKLHSQVIMPKENKISLTTLKNKKIVILADEAHHLLASTKTQNKQLLLDDTSWEDTVKKDLLLLNPENILLEYSATINLEDENIKKEYEDKIVIKYGLKEFREDKYSKDIYLFKSDLCKNKRILTALIMSFYRQNVAEYYSSKSSDKVLYCNNNFKSIILVKSSNIKKSIQDMDDFKNFLPTIKKEDIEEILNSNEIRIEKAKEWFYKKRKYTSEDILKHIKIEFGFDFNITLRQINSQNNSDEKKSKILSELNNLDSDDNKIRIIFTVKMLTEGWDVLSLYDIVRLDEGDINIKKAVQSDIQLIGRGCRYNPFYIDTDINEKYKRKFDNDLNNDLRCLEEFYYHSKNDNKYISSLKEELRKEGLQDNNNNKDNSHIINLKKNIESFSRWQNRLFYCNNLKEIQISDKKSIFDYNVPKEYNKIIKSNEIIISNIYSDKNKYNEEKTITKEFQINKRILIQAMDINSFYTFQNLINYLPNMKTKEELINEIINNIKITIEIPKEKILTKYEEVEILSDILKSIEKHIKKNNYKFRGSEIFKSKKLKDILKSYKIISITANDNNSKGHSIMDADEKIRVNLKEKDWYPFDDFYGNKLEKQLIRFISDKIEDKKYPFDKCEDILLVRNYGFCKLYDFKTDKAFMPDFLLYFTRKNEKMNFMLYVEPKGEHLKGEDNDKWKEDFMLEIENKSTIEDGNNYKIIGLKFFTEENNQFPDNLKEVFDKNNIK